MKVSTIKKITAIFFCSLLIFNNSYTCQAASKTLSITRVRQAKSQWCWAAASEMVGKYSTSSSKDQWYIVDFIWGPTYPNVGGSVANMVSSVQFASDYSKSATSSSSLLALSTIQSKITSGKPMIARLAWNSSDGHAIVFSGYNDSNIRCIDPWEETSTTYYSYASLRDGGTFLTGSGKVNHTVYY